MVHNAVNQKTRVFASDEVGCHTVGENSKVAKVGVACDYRRLYAWHERLSTAWERPLFGEMVIIKAQAISQ